ncbi:DUF6637 family protein [Oribacterium sp. HCP28S3_H8]|jgi:uncharacterized membrane protein HdeD (DUF308 family)|uniref:DUF6637 family protein n=1 Tax=Oribacterium sp. HCP28S3_H8 TaxID=3438945 RepID=UPI003051220F|nr:hypothetical protein [Oribacterium sp.]
MYQGHTGARSSSRKLDFIHIVLGIVLVVMAIFAFINPGENMVLFPLIFYTAAAIRIISAVFLMRSADHDRKILSQGIAQLVLGLLILLVGIASMVSIWF